MNLKESRLRGTGRYLAPGEQIIRTIRRHPVVIVKPILWWLFSLLAVGLISFVLTEGNPIPLVDQVVLVLALAMTAYTGYRILDWWRSYFVITDERVLLLQGIISVKVTAVRLSRVAETSFSRSVMGRILGYGELKLDAAGEQIKLASLGYLPKPEEVYRLVTSLLLGHEEPEYPTYDPSEEITGPLPPVTP